MNKLCGFVKDIGLPFKNHPIYRTIVIICILMIIPQFRCSNNFDLWGTLGSIGLEFGAAVILILFIDKRAESDELRKNKATRRFLANIIESILKKPIFLKTEENAGGNIDRRIHPLRGEYEFCINYLCDKHTDPVFFDGCHKDIKRDELLMDLMKSKEILCANIERVFYCLSEKEIDIYNEIKLNQAIEFYFTIKLVENGQYSSLKELYIFYPKLEKLLYTLKENGDGKADQITGDFVNYGNNTNG